jgi:hypothetical protein
LATIPSVDRTVQHERPYDGKAGAARFSPLPDIKIYEDTQAVLRSRDVMKRAAISSLYFPTTDEKLIQTHWMHRYAGQEIAGAFSIAARNTTP